MQIITDHRDHFVEMRLVGRLDNEWAGHLNDAIDEAIRKGSHTLVLNMTEVSYVTSAGLGALVRAYKQFQTIHGFFGIGKGSSFVLEIIRKTGLGRMLLCDVDQIRRKPADNPASIQAMSRVELEWGVSLDEYDLDTNATQVCEVIGDATRLPHQAYSAADCRTVEFPEGSIGLGLGALGQDFADCENRFGEFLAVSGSVAQLPTSSTDKPDYQLSQGRFVPQVQLAYGVRCTGPFRKLYRFDSPDGQHQIPLSSLIDECLALTQSELATVVLVAESSGLVGASLRRSPAAAWAGHTTKFEHPEIRNWLSYSADRVFPHTVALAVGIASRSQGGPLGSFTRLLGPHGQVHGHFHAAVFSYRPFKKRTLELESTVAALFDTEELKSVMHLLHDDRENSAGESHFVRGACWVAPISHVTGEISK